MYVSPLPVPSFTQSVFLLDWSLLFLFPGATSWFLHFSLLKKNPKNDAVQVSSVVGWLMEQRFDDDGRWWWRRWGWWWCCCHSAILLTGAFFRGRGTSLTQRPPSFHPAILAYSPDGLTLLIYIFLLQYMQSNIKSNFKFSFLRWIWFPNLSFNTLHLNLQPNFSPDDLTLVQKTSSD